MSCSYLKYQFQCFIIFYLTFTALDFLIKSFESCRSCWAFNLIFQFKNNKKIPILRRSFTSSPLLYWCNNNKFVLTKERLVGHNSPEPMSCCPGIGISCCVKCPFVLGLCYQRVLWAKSLAQLSSNGKRYVTSTWKRTHTAI